MDEGTDAREGGLKRRVSRPANGQEVVDVPQEQRDKFTE